MNTENLEILKTRLEQLDKKEYKHKFAIPKVWIDCAKNTETIELNPFQFFLNQIAKIEELSKSAKSKPKRSSDKLVYNLFPRYATAFDHNSDKDIAIEIEENQFRETGTFLKCIALLPYIKSLGCNLIYTLPVTSIGIDGKKGSLGSPYAIRNPLELEETLSEPILDLDIDSQYKAFVEAAHLLGIAIVNEFVFRTASIDSDLALEHPEWFYWIQSRIKDREVGNTSEARYGMPMFNKKELAEIKAKVASGDFENTVPPHEQHRKMFNPTPLKVARVESKIFGVTGKSQESRIPSAFADWPPDDNQPAWSDVTYLKYYDAQDFNYIAYNTIRMYDAKLAKKKNKVDNLWEFVSNIIPTFQDKYGIDGVMIDMGHSLPEALLLEIIKKARAKNSEFIFWEENFLLSEESISNGYDGVLGYACFDEHEPDKFKDIVELFPQAESTIPQFFATSETHNTKRAYARFKNRMYNLMTFKLNRLLPSIPFIHNGFELCEETPVNTGLGFTDEEIAEYPAEKLPLFSLAAMNWQNENSIIDEMIEYNKMLSNIDFTNNVLDSIDLGSGMVAFYRNVANEKLLAIASMKSEQTEIDLNRFEGTLHKDLNEEAADKTQKLILNQFDVAIYLVK